MLRKLFEKKRKSSVPRGFFEATISTIQRVTNDTVKVTLDLSESVRSNFQFTAGQYLTFSIEINGKQERRSYSICSGPGEELSVAIKQVKTGLVSTWFNQMAEEGQSVFISRPEGAFTLQPAEKNVVAVAAGSGITPVLSIAKHLEGNGRMELFYGSRTKESTIFREEIDALQSTKVHHFLSGEERSGYGQGRIDKTAFMEVIKTNLHLLNSDAFFICGPEAMIMEIDEVLKTFGVSKEKVRFELFTPPVLMKPATEKTESDFSGNSKVEVLLDDELISFDLDANGMNILDRINKEGYDAPYSCKGGVCCTCKAKVLKGKATMKFNYALTDKEVEEGYILTCQAHPASDTLELSYDE